MLLSRLRRCVSKTATTRMVTLPLLPSTVPVIVATPGATTVTIPLALTDAIVVSLPRAALT